MLATLGAAFLVASGGIHLDLYLTGYDGVPTIGLLFVLQAATAFSLGVTVLISVHPFPSAAGAALSISTLCGYLVSLAIRLFGFHEVPTTAGSVAGSFEILAFVALGLSAAQPGATSLCRLWPLVPAIGAAAAVVLGIELGLVLPTTSTPLSGRAGFPVVTVTLPGFGAVLATRSYQSLYLLSDEQYGHIACAGGCLSLWPPLLLSPKTARIRAGQGFRGGFGEIRRGSREQLTYYGFPLYTYVGDSGPRGSAGEGIASNGGIWYLVRADALMPADVAVKRAAGRS